MDTAVTAEERVDHPASGGIDNVKPTPPHESSSTQRTRRWIIFSFWAVVICFGLPHWIRTTSTYRASLPLTTMNSWAEGKTCWMHYPLAVQLSVPRWDLGQESDLAVKVQDVLNLTLPLYEIPVFVGDYNDGSPKPPEMDEALTVVLDVNDTTDGPDHTSSLESWAPVLRLSSRVNSPSDLDRLAQWVAGEVMRLFKAEHESLAYLISGTPFSISHGALTCPEAQTKLDARSTRAFKYASTYHLTFSLFTSASSPSAWEIDAALNKYIEPLVNALSRISNITVDTQVQLHASLSPSIAGPQYDAASREWKLRKSDLSGFINAAEWPLSPSISAGPTINFVLYVPAKAQSPLVIAETGGTSWLVPQWGGVAILNPGGVQPVKLTVADLEPVMLTFAEQLTLLIGLPSSPPSLALRLSSLTRERATSLIISASSTLGALARLTLKLISIAIPDSVAKSVDETISRLDRACRDLRAGRYDSALENARIANDEAERAFFEPSMVGQVYFPDEHKVAVYVPLLGPMAVPLVMTALKELSKWKVGRKMKSA